MMNEIRKIKYSRLPPIEMYLYDLLEDMNLKNGSYSKLLPDKSSISSYFRRELLHFYTDSPIDEFNQLIISHSYVRIPLCNKFNLHHRDINKLVCSVFNNIYGTNYPPSYFY